MKHRSVSLLVKTFVAVLSLVIYCEYLIFYIAQRHCDYPVLDSKNEEGRSARADQQLPVRAMVLADTHLLGSRKGHWFDKMRREWQMYRSFQTAMALHRPDVVFVLGDLTDEGLWSTDDAFQRYVKRFYSLFAVPDGTQMHVVVGNHDIGFHYGISAYLNQRFEKAFNAPAVQLLTIRGNHFVLLNSMALEGDGCFLCRPAEYQLTKIEKSLKCSKGIDYGKCKTVTYIGPYSRPILLQHFPLYRESDMECHEPDSAPMSIKKEVFKERWECLSQESTEQLMRQIDPRLAISGHTHHGCKKQLPTKRGLEVTVPSFSWRNKNNPSYSLLTITPNNYEIFRCDMAKESHMAAMYGLGGIGMLFWFILNVYSRKSKFLQYSCILISFGTICVLLSNILLNWG